MKMKTFSASRLTFSWDRQAEYADIVLPAAHYLELNDIYDMHPRFFISAHNKCVEPPGEARSDA